MEKLPEIGKTYNHYDDGKVSKSRLYRVTVKKIIQLSELDDEYRELWEQDIHECDWLYANETDYIIIGEDTENNDIHYYTRTIQGTWYSFGTFWTGVLDVNGNRYEQQMKYYDSG